MANTPVIGSTASRNVPVRRSRPTAFSKPIMHTRPLLPDLAAYSKRLEDIWASEYITNGGPQQIQLESRLKEYLQSRHLSVYSSGTTALIAALAAMRLTGEVVTTPFTFAATPHAIGWAGCRPVFADIEPSTLNLDVDAAAAAITPNTSAILAVHVFGAPCNVTGLAELANRHGLKLIYDAAHAFGAVIGESPISSFGDASVFSLHATKLFHSAEGGAIATRDAALHETLIEMRNFGIRAPSGTVTEIGLNGKLSELQAALGLEVLELVADERARRHAISEIYLERLAEIDGVQPVRPPDSVTSSYQYFPVLIDETYLGCSRDELVRQLERFNVFARKYFFPLCSEFAPYRKIPSARADNLPNANKAV